MLLYRKGTGWVGICWDFINIDNVSDVIGYNELKQADMYNATMKYTELLSFLDRNISLWNERTQSNCEVNFFSIIWSR